jgi:hypothetical protein
VLTIVDIFSRFSPVLEPRLTFRGAGVVAKLERVCNEEGSEFVSRDPDLWAYLSLGADETRPHAQNSSYCWSKLRSPSNQARTLLIAG